MESLQNEAVQEMKESQVASMTSSLDKINESPELKAFYDSIENSAGAPLGDIFTRDLSGLGMGEPEEVELEEVKEPEEAEEEEEEEEAEEVEETETEAEEEPQEAAPKKKKDKYTLQRESYDRLQQLQEKEARLQEAERRNEDLLSQMEALKLSEQQSWQTAITHYEHNLKHDYARGEAMLDLAIENFDEKAKFKAYSIMQEAEAKLNSLKDYAPLPAQPQGAHRFPRDGFDRDYIAQLPSYKAPAQPQANDSNLVLWVKKNPIIDPESIYFKPELRQKVINHAKKYEQDLTQEGRSNLIGSSEYFSAMDGYIRGYLEIEKERLLASPASKKPSTSHIGSVKGAGAIGASKAKIDLSPEELSMISDMQGDQEKIKAKWLENKMKYKNTTIGLHGARR